MNSKLPTKQKSVVIRDNPPLSLENFKDYEFFFPLVVCDKGWIDIVGLYDEVKGIQFFYRVSFRPCFDGPVLYQRLPEAIQAMNDGQQIFDAT